MLTQQSSPYLNCKRPRSLCFVACLSNIRDRPVVTVWRVICHILLFRFISCESIFFIETINALVKYVMLDMMYLLSQYYWGYCISTYYEYEILFTFIMIQTFLSSPTLDDDTQSHFLFCFFLIFPLFNIWNRYLTDSVETHFKTKDH